VDSSAVVLGGELERGRQPGERGIDGGARQVGKQRVIVGALEPAAGDVAGERSREFERGAAAGEIAYRVAAYAVAVDVEIMDAGVGAELHEWFDAGPQLVIQPQPGGEAVEIAVCVAGSGAVRKYRVFVNGAVGEALELDSR
jgi:hypothetical protein